MAAEAATRLLALALIAGAALSSFLVLRQAPVGPTDHADQLAELRPLVQGQDVLFLGRDNFVAYELRGSRPFTAVRNFYDPNYVKPEPAARGRVPQVRLRLGHAGDAGSLPVRDHDPRCIPAERAPGSSFVPLRKTADFVLWKRTGPVGPRRTLAEGADPGAGSSRLPGEGDAGAAGERIGDGVREGAGDRRHLVAERDGGGRLPGDADAQTLPPGRWRISLQYDATQSVRVSAPGLEATLPANLDYRGSVPFYPAGELVVPRAGSVRFTVSVERPPSRSGSTSGTRIASAPAAMPA